jgi:ATP/maltotriose-dependent transcriptional regulator MalT
MAAPLNARDGYASPQLRDVLERSITLAQSLGHRDWLVTGMVELWTSLFVRGRTAEGYETATHALALVQPGSERASAAHFAVGGSALSLGRPAEALRHLNLAARLAGGAVWLFVGTRPDVHGTAFSAHAHWLLGQDDDARAACRDAIELARAIDHQYSLAVALAYGSTTLQMCGDMAGLRGLVAELRALCDRYGFAYYREWGLILDGWCRGGEAGTDLARRGVGNLRSSGSFARMPYWMSLLADLLVRGGQPDAARATLDAALAAAQAYDDRWWLPEVMRMRAAYDEPRAAAARLRSAAQLAADQGSVALVRRIERDLAY